jgi:hypothetical protein
MKITRKWLEQHNACKDGKEWCLSHGELTIQELFPIFMKHEKYDWLNWLLVRLMDQRQRTMYAIFAAESVLHIFEKKYPNDQRPRRAIAAAQAYLKNPCEETKKAADAAYTAARVAAYTAAADAYAAARAAYTAAYAAARVDAAARAAYIAAYTAARVDAYAADAAYAAAADDKGKTYIKILTYGFELITKG